MELEAGAPAAISLKDRFLNLRTAASFLIGLGILFFLVTRVDIDFREVWANIRQAELLPYVAAIGVYYSSFAARAYRWRRLLHNAGVEWDAIPRVRDLVEIIYLSWFANSIVPAKLGDLYRGYLVKKEAAISFSLSMGTIVAERLLDFVVLVTLMGAAGLVSYRGRLPQEIINLLAVTFAIVVAVIVGLLAVRRFGDLIQRRLPERAGDLYHRFSGAMLLSFQRFPELLTYTVLAWACESARVWFVIMALGGRLPVSMVIFLGLLAALLTTLPLTPGGLGFAEAGLTGALVLYGLGTEQALTITALDRTISFLSLLVGGLVVYLLSRKTK